MKTYRCLLIAVAAAISVNVVGYAQVVWQREPMNPVIPVWGGDPDDPNLFRHTINPSVFYNAGTKHFLGWFTSWVWGSSVHCISHAYSPDGIRWYIYAKNPVIKPSASGFDQNETSAPTVVWRSPLYRMYYQGREGNTYAIGLATSSDGVAWQKYANNPVLTAGPPGSWDRAGVLYANVMFLNATYMMWYSGRDGNTSRIGLATSPDGIIWTKYAGNPILVEGSPGQWDAYFVEAPGVTVKDGIFYMLYTARPSQDGPQFLGLATSADGVHWTKYSGNPVFLPQPGAWDEANVAAPSLMFHDQKFKMWYGGLRYVGGYTQWQVGYATSNPVSGLIPVTPGVPAKFEVSANYPNPFNPTTQIRIGIPETGDISVRIFDVLGRDIWKFTAEKRTPGWHTFEWNGVSSSGERVASGIYIYRVEFLSEGNAPLAVENKMSLVK
jgi:predicted GH43/DUF377 family glycosyl hydrolase